MKAPASCGLQRVMSALWIAVATCLLALAATPAKGETWRATDVEAAAMTFIAGTCPDGVSEDFIRRADWDGDGREDVLVSSADGCEGSRMAWCGSFGCHYQLWFARPGGGFVTGLNEQVRLVLPDTWQGRPAVKVVVHGEVCFRAGHEGCTSIAVWDPKTETLKTVWKDY